MTKKYVNPALQQESIGEPASIIPPREDESLYRWIKSTGRFLPRQSDIFYDEKKTTDELEDILDEDETTEDDMNK